MALPSWLMEAVRRRGGQRGQGFASGPPPVPAVMPRPDAPPPLPPPMAPPPSEMAPPGGYGVGQAPRGEALRQQMSMQPGLGMTQAQPVDPVQKAREQDMLLAALRELIRSG